MFKRKVVAGETVPPPVALDTLLPVIPALRQQAQQMRADLANLMAQIVAVSVALERADALFGRVDEQVQQRLTPAEFTAERRQRE